MSGHHAQDIKSTFDKTMEIVNSSHSSCYIQEYLLTQYIQHHAQSLTANNKLESANLEVERLKSLLLQEKAKSRSLSNELKVQRSYHQSDTETMKLENTLLRMRLERSRASLLEE